MLLLGLGLDLVYKSLSDQSFPEYISNTENRTDRTYFSMNSGYTQYKG